jgi:hypothetical protein
MKRLTLHLFLTLWAGAALMAQTPSLNDAVELAATVQTNPARITISWQPHAGANNYTIYRKLKADQSWGGSIGSLGGSSSQFADNNVAIGTYYEYKITRSGGGNGTGYIASGIELAAVENRGKLILLVDNDIKNGITSELNQLSSDLENDGWTVIRHDVSRNTPVPNVRTTIKNDYLADPTRVKAVYIIGHVPVPYSGNLNPDGHAEHKGAWSADGYYGDMDGTWTDNTVNSTGATDPRNRNVPGDGKFDQSDYPNALELQVGRIDFYNMGTPWYAFPMSETQLTANYLSKAHDYKVRQFVPQRRGIVFDNFQYLSDPLAGGGYRNVAALVGASNLSDIYPYAQPFYTYVDNQSYLWTYASGGGTWVSADNVGTTDNFASISTGGVFNMVFGSYFGDWDVTNNFMKSIIAGGQGLTCVWSGIPHWYFQHMGMGDNIGYSALTTMNNQGLYSPQSGGWQGPTYSRVHLGLLGDPSLRMTVVPRPSNFQAVNSGGLTSFSWTAAMGSVDGYYIYAMEADGTLNRVSPNLISGNSYSDPAIPFVSGRKYMLRAVKLQVSNTGTYYDLSLGVQATSAGSPVPDCNGVVGGPAVPGSSCNDGDPCTTNDVLNANCQCAGTPSPDNDGDGICNSQDNCPNVTGQIGSACNDGNACTINDVLNANCQCAGTPAPDSDNDGICNSQDNCPNVPGQIGSACNDGTANTVNDVLNANCQCVGTPVVLDCNGVPNGPAMPGTSCNDGDPCTYNDQIQPDCGCVGTPAPDSDNDGICNSQDNCPNVPGQIGSSCNDGDPCTLNDVLNANCQCAGTPAPDNDNDGICNSQDNCPDTPGQIGSACNDGNPNTINDLVNANCQCVGAAPPPLDCQGVPNGPAMPGTPCNDNDPSTGNDHWNANCNCVGQTIDCNGTPGGGALPGTSCNDGDPCTINDVLNANCQCAGTPAPDNDNDGICNSQDNCPNVPGQIGSACNDGNPNTINDVLNANCQCAGSIAPPEDCLGVPNGPAMPGSACNDNDPSTGNDHWNANCQCVGQLIDCNGLPGGTALPGTPCDDGDPNTGNDVYGTDCTCLGTTGVIPPGRFPGALPDCAGIVGGAAFLDDCGTCAGGTTGLIPNADTDADGLISCEDNCSTAFNPGQADFDEDGVGDACDNCVWVANGDQLDANGNGIGDACESGTTGIPESISLGRGMALWPNPAQDRVLVRCDDAQVRSLKFLDPAGRSVMELPYEHEVDLGPLATGTYMVLAVDGNGEVIAHARLVKL